MFKFKFQFHSWQRRGFCMRLGFYWNPLKRSFYLVVWNFDNQINKFPNHLGRTIVQNPGYQPKIAMEIFASHQKSHPFFLSGKNLVSFGTARPKVFNSFSSSGGWKLRMMMLLGGFLLFGESGGPFWRYVDVSENSGCLPPQIIPLENRGFHYKVYPCWGIPLFLETPM